ncbi:hypothetical protein MKW94_030086 [Papaver nudicaule]|uniref:RNA polymerase II C-terminal domain phosphatase-like n=1 Tax=Papaver nudicaule TaxID=74823 RepID=A0AA41W0S8_PAPNU|nr:hypothetical protein [Papaver nudicaule]
MPPIPLMMISNSTEELAYNRKENKRLVELSQMLGNTYRQSFAVRKKLCLVLDLDHTLLHSVRIQDVSVDDQEYLNARVSSMKDMDGNNLYKPIEFYTKLRPHTREFLKKASGMFKLFIYTMGSRDYAQDMARLLDPDGVLFKNNIASRDDYATKNRKHLDVLAGPNKKNTIIVDDSKHVWHENKKNLILIDKYEYFVEEKGSHKLKKDDEQKIVDEDEALQSISEVLQDVHKTVFEFFAVPRSPVELQEYVKSLDVRPILKLSKEKFMY